MTLLVATTPEIDTVVVSVPSDAMTGTISVKVLNGTAATSLQSFVVLPVSLPEITSIAPTSGPVNTEVTNSWTELWRYRSR